MINASELKNIAFFLNIKKLLKFQNIEIVQGLNNNLLVKFYCPQIDDEIIFEICQLFQKNKKTFSLYAEKELIELFYVD